MVPVGLLDGGDIKRVNKDELEALFKGSLRFESIHIEPRAMNCQHRTPEAALEFQLSNLPDNGLENIPEPPLSPIKQEYFSGA